MTLDYETLESMRQSHPAWRLLCAAQAPLVVSFLNRVFIVPNIRSMSEPDLAEKLEDELYALRLREGEKSFPKTAREYLTDWAANDKGWLRKFYIADSDEAHYDLTTSSEKAIAWLASLSERSFVGTESRLLTLFELLKQMSQGAETDPAIRIEELSRKRDEIDAEIGRMHLGDFSLLDDSALRDRFQQFVTLARELLTDFREVEQNFRGLDRRTREQIAMWEGSKGALLEEIMGTRDAIADSDQGHSFRAFWDFLMSSRRQEELTQLIDRVLSLPAVTTLNPDSRLRRIHYDWLDAGEHTQKTVALLSQQLRRFLDDQVWLENRRIMDILHEIEAKAIALRATPPQGEVMTIDASSADIELPFERPLYAQSIKAHITEIASNANDDEIDTDALFSQQVVDTALLAKHIRQALQERTNITLRELIELRPLQHGLAELMAYMQLAVDTFEAAFDDEQQDVIRWNTDHEGMREATVPRVTFVR